MTKTKNPLFSLGASGTVANSITYSRRRKTNIMQAKPVLPYFLTLPSQYQRWLYSDYVYQWHQLSQAQKQDYASRGVRHHLTGFQYYMKYNLTNLPDIAGYWKLDDNLGATTIDSSRNSNTGTIIGASPATGLIDGCLSFDGINDLVDCGNSPTLNPTPLFSLEAFTWKSASVVPGGEMILCKDAGAQRSYSLQLHLNDLTIYFQILGLVPSILAVITTFNDSVWHHWVGTWDGSFLRIYKDGSQIGSLATAGTPQASTQDLLIGTKGDGSGWFSGLIDHAIVHYRALDPTEVLQRSQRRWPH